MVRKYSLYCAWLLACIGVLGSLYFSEMLHIAPCNLCWYQRMALFPLAVILGVATYGSDLRVIRYALPLAIMGFCFALYQVMLQEIPGWNPLHLCGKGPSCSEKIDIGLGPITIPLLSTTNFLLISLLLIAPWYSTTKEALEFFKKR
jgi:disulfide bond formation protein DsbB